MVNLSQTSTHPLANGKVRRACPEGSRRGRAPSPYTNSIITRRPTMAAARYRLERVMSSVALKSRSTCDRLVLSRVAILFLEIFFFFMASASCQATTSLTAWGLRLFKYALFFQKVIHARSHVSPAHCSNSFLRLRARAKSSFGVVRVFLIKPCGAVGDGAL